MLFIEKDMKNILVMKSFDKQVTNTAKLNIELEYDYEKLKEEMWKEKGIGQGLNEYFGRPNKLFV